MRRMRNPKTGELECDTKNDPPDYSPGQGQRCDDLFQNILDGVMYDKDQNHYQKPNLPTHLEEKMKTVDKIIYVEDLSEEARGGEKLVKEECYNPDLLKKYGWCYLIDFPKGRSNSGSSPSSKQEAWGVCSPSCDPEIIKVSFTYEIFLNLE